MLQKISIISLAVLCLIGCKSPTDAPTTVTQGTATSSDDVTIAYDVRGQGSPALVFIHGWSCNRSFWKHQVDVFAKDHRVITLDLGGHGQSGDARIDWSIDQYASDVQAVVKKVGPRKAILVGHSLGGPVALKVAKLMPGRIIAVIGADTLHNAEKGYERQDFEQALLGLQSDFAGTMAGAIDAMLPQTVDPTVRDWIVSQACQTDPQVAISTLAALPDADIKACFSQAPVPIRCINAAPFEPVNTETKIETNRQYADYDAVLMQGVGHFPQLEKPAEFNTHLRNWIKDLTNP